MSSNNPFDFINAISDKKGEFTKDDVEQNYVPFVTNKAFSYHMDTLQFSQLMNQHADLSKSAQYDFFINTVKKRNRFAKWHKPIQDSEEFKVVQEYFKFNRKKTFEALRVLSEKQITLIKEKLEKGG